MKKINLLLIEDDDYKKDKIFNFLNHAFTTKKTIHASSVNSAKTIIDNLSEDFIILLDMSLPTYNIENNSSGGRPQGFGGIEILRYMEMIEKNNSVIVITQYENFTIYNRVIECKDLEKDLLEEFDKNFYGLVHFNSITDNWKSDLENLVGKILNDKYSNC